jgi:hypothetical protein
MTLNSKRRRRKILEAGIIRKELQRPSKIHRSRINFSMKLSKQSVKLSKTAQRLQLKNYLRLQLDQCENQSPSIK